MDSEGRSKREESLEVGTGWALGVSGPRSPNKSPKFVEGAEAGDCIEGVAEKNPSKRSPDGFVVDVGVPAIGAEKKSNMSPLGCTVSVFGGVVNESEPKKSNS